MNRELCVTCGQCQGDPRRSATCSACGGAGIGVPSVHGFLVWDAPADPSTFAFRAFRRKANALVNVSLFMIALGVLIAWMVMWVPEAVVNLPAWPENSPWSDGKLWLGLLLGCVGLIRAQHLPVHAKSLPYWQKTREEIEKAERHPKQAQFRVDCSPYFTDAAWEIVEHAVSLSTSHRHVEVTPVSLAASAMASPVGSLLLYRLGLTFAQVKDGIATALAQEPVGQPPVHFSVDTKCALTYAFTLAEDANVEHVGAPELLQAAIFASPALLRILDRLGASESDVRLVLQWIRNHDRLLDDRRRFVWLASLKPAGIMDRAMTARRTPLLDRYREELTLAARAGYLPPIEGRQEEIESMLRALESDRGVVLIGEVGAGKFAIIEELARRMVTEDVPEILQDKRLVAVQLPQLIASGDPSMAADRLIALLQEVRASGNILLALIGIDALVGAGMAGQRLDLAEILATELSKGDLRLVATVTPDAWTSTLESRSLGSRLVSIPISVMDEAQTLQVLLARSGFVEYQTTTRMTLGALKQAASLAHRLLRNLAAPESALELLKDAGMKVKTQRGTGSQVFADDVAQIVHVRTKVPVQALGADESERLLNLEARLQTRVIGQVPAISAVSNALRRARSGIRSESRPIGSFLFLGPTGVGKTELAKALAAEYFGDESAMIRLDMSEYQQASSVDRLIGIPGDARGGLLTEAIRNRPYGLILLDELEKAHPDVRTIFLQLMEDGRVTDGVGRTVDATQSLVIATSNAGSSFIQDQMIAGTDIEEVRKALLDRELRGIFAPEFLNRFDQVIVFAPLFPEEVREVTKLLIVRVAKKLEAQGIALRVDEAAVDRFVAQGYDAAFGARPLRRLIQDTLENAIANLLLTGKVHRQDQVVLYGDGHLEVIPAT